MYLKTDFGVLNTAKENDIESYELVYIYFDCSYFFVSIFFYDTNCLGYHYFSSVTNEELFLEHYFKTFFFISGKQDFLSADCTSLCEYVILFLCHRNQKFNKALFTILHNINIS